MFKKIATWYINSKILSRWVGKRIKVIERSMVSEWNLNHLNYMKGMWYTVVLREAGHRHAFRMCSSHVTKALPS